MENTASGQTRGEHRLRQRLQATVVGALLCSTPVAAQDWLVLEDVSARFRLSEQTVLGDDAPEEFDAYDVAANFLLPWDYYSDGGWGIGSEVMFSVGLLRGAGETALVVSAVPEITFGSEDGRFQLDLGAGFALFSRHQFGVQDFGGPFQFALTAGLRIPIYKQWGLGYRFQHYSDAGVNGPDTTGADLHMLEVVYRF
ncbi:acyloxyacyl hydrolase [Ferrimonas marina]|nr:acyloxyacyl hydrolase [Ferrimonas marina]